MRRHTHPKARRDDSAPEAAPATGINYLELLAARHEEATKQAISYHAAATRGIPTPAEQTGTQIIQPGLWAEVTEQHLANAEAREAAAIQMCEVVT